MVSNGLGKGKGEILHYCDRFIILCNDRTKRMNLMLVQQIACDGVPTVPTNVSVVKRLAKMESTLTECASISLVIFGSVFNGETAPERYFDFFVDLDCSRC